MNEAGKSPPPLAQPPHPLRTVAITSGKGGVGKTTIVANLAVALAARHQRVCVLDGDVALPDLHIVLGLAPDPGLTGVLRGAQPLTEAVTTGPGGIGVIGGGREAAELGTAEQLCLLDAIDNLDGRFETLLIDTPTGATCGGLFLAAAAAEVLVVVTPEPTSLADAYALVSRLATRFACRAFVVVVNMASSSRQAAAAFRRLTRQCPARGSVRLQYLGHLPADPAVAAAVRVGRPVALVAPRARVTRAFSELARRLEARPLPAPTGGLQFVYRRLLDSHAPR